MKFFNKLFKKKKSEQDKPEEDIQSNKKEDISFAVTRPDMEGAPSIGEIDIYINDEKIDTYKISQRPIIIGRDPSKSNIIISELIVSKSHCTIYNEDNNTFIRDNNSTNGIYMDNEKISEKELKDNDVILLGKKGTIKIIFHKTSEDVIEE